MGKPGETLDDHEITQKLVRHQIAMIHTVLPGVIVSYDEATQKVSVRASISSRFEDRNGVVQVQTQPTISNVPVAFPSSTNNSITWPLTPGDPCLLVFAERSLDEWKSTGGTDIEASHLRRHSLTDAICLPGCTPFSSPLPSSAFDSTAMVLRADEIRLVSAAATALIALGTLVDSVFTTVRTFINSHTHTSALPGVPTSPPIVPLAALPSTKASKVKAI